MQREETQLAIAESALARNDTAAALRALVAAYERTRDDRVAALVRAVAAELPPVDPVGTGRTAAAQHAWIARAEADDPVDLAALLPTLASPDTTRATERMRAIQHRVDPRIADAVLALLLELPLRGDRPPYWEAQIDLLVGSADGRVRAAIAELAPRYASVFATSVGANVARILERALGWIDASGRQAIEGDEARALAAIEARYAHVLRDAAYAEKKARNVTRSLADLVADVYANPDDDAPRAVLADALLEQGMPQGELIQLQLAEERGALDEAGRARVDAILDQYETRFLGELAPVWHAVGYRRGFPYAVTVAPDRKTLASATNPAWRTIREINASISGSGWAHRTTLAFLKLLAAPHLERVEVLERVPIDAIPELPALPLTRLGTYAFPRASLPALLDALPRFPRLGSLFLVLHDRERLDDVLGRVLAAAPDLAELELSALITELGPGCVLRAFHTRLERLRLSGATPLVLERAANGAGFHARVRLTTEMWLGESTAEQVVRWVEVDPDAPIVSFQLESSGLFDDDQRARLRAVLGERFSSSTGAP
jgi:uncharacterized protein (TIGR02996 family)